MTAYTTLINATFLPGKPILGSTGSALRDNPLAGLEADSTAPVNQTAWHPYNKVTNGDTNTGLIYDFGVSGAVATVVSPDFVDGYEYRFRFSGISVSAGTAVAFNAELYAETSAVYNSTSTLFSASTASILTDGWLVVYRPRLSSVNILSVYQFGVQAASNSTGAAAPSGYYDTRTTAQKRLKARFGFASGNIDAGQIYMDRRRVIV